MFVLRLVGFLLLITIGASLVTFLLTRNRRYLIFAWQVLKYGMVMAIVVLASPPPVGVTLPDHLKRRDVTVRPHPLAGYDQLTEANDDDE